MIQNDKIDKIYVKLIIMMKFEHQGHKLSIFYHNDINFISAQTL
jgi:hypothetical protein